MITIRFKTPKDYWKQYKEWLRTPKKKEVMEMIDYYHSLLGEELSKDNALSFLSNQDIEKVDEELCAISNLCRYKVEKLIKSIYR